MRAVHPGRLTVQCWIGWCQVLTIPKELYRHAKMSHGTQEESIHWAKRKDIGASTGGVGIVVHVPSPTSVLEGCCGTVLEIDRGILWHWGRGKRMCRACFKGSGSEAVRGNPQLQEAVLLSPSHAGWRGSCLCPGPLWMDSVQQSVEGPLTDRVSQGKFFSSFPEISCALTAWSPMTRSPDC